jgi:hypothetical protein
MKVNEITEGAWDFMMGALNPMSKKSLIGAQKGVDAAGNPIHYTSADYKVRPNVDDYETRYRQQYLDQATAIEKGALAPDHVSSVTRKGIDQTRREANMPPVDWAKIDAEYEAKKAAVAAPPPTPRSATNQYGVMTAQATPAKYSKIPPMGGQATASWVGSGQQPYTTSINNITPAPAKKAKPAPASAPATDDTAMSPEERRNIITTSSKVG